MERSKDFYKFTDDEYERFLNGEEIWRHIEKHEDYMVSTFGRVISFKHKKKGRFNRPSVTHNGYLRIQLFEYGKAYSLPVHRLVGDAFLKNELNKPEINHMNLIKDFNMLYNLEWVTKTENSQHAVKHGRLGKYWRGKIGNECPHSKKILKCDELGNVVDVFYGSRDVVRRTGMIRSRVQKSIKNSTFIDGFVFKYE